MFEASLIQVNNSNDLKNLADEFYDITGVKARLIGCQGVY